MKKISAIFISLIACIVMTSCVEQNNPDKIKQEPTESTKLYQSIEDYHEEIGKRTVITKPTFHISDKKLQIQFDILYPDDLEQKFKHTKKNFYYAIKGVAGQDKLDPWIEKSHLPVYANNLDAMPKGKNGYKYHVTIPLKKQPSEAGKKN
ncbi:hypothetical protein P5G51_013515 [Virgibacillus sp. 179-BFC.A HS]|uniref:Lipoprotein n=1 Tax=Tigheibacillus jepli TaxID=3035914 RepID=A0ABU5CKD2_9BACI|nr:hypothetical protein [Virgibacillus sp. 179-BFC.A HS]MDY0406274.1 hypothetical protein [Virgibacillus sp. 179-BFC.A HS]